MIPKELTPEEFTINLVTTLSEPIMAQIKRAENYPGEFNVENFVSEWQSWMRLGIARAWSVKHGYIGATFTRQLFSGDKAATVVFWHATPECKKALSLLEAVTTAATQADCKVLYASAFKSLRGRAMRRLFRMRGFREVETSFRKELNHV